MKKRTRIQATFPISGRTFTYNSATALTKVLSGTGEVNRILQNKITKSAQNGSRVNGIRITYA